ncbi:hypothetical protein [Adhaeribacter aquaticus]|uniref:hypothetical protein n=1 Tax=Adhaeribacter aquaticus TaxID=299567 RepID=UPI0003FDD888|nr:hypothetical protein [Adhaeribacter aquaticus]
MSVLKSLGYFSFLVLLGFFPAGCSKPEKEKELVQPGCTDPSANNYKAGATSNDGSCAYNSASVFLTNAKTLPATLNQSSGLVHTNNQLWTISNKFGDNTIYRINEDGAIQQTITIAGANNADWEAITADANYFYIGDFGNNLAGNRTDLRIYRVSKSGIGSGATGSVPAEVIQFSYKDQDMNTPTGSNDSDFDCEAFVVKGNTLHLFTKQWKSNKTTHYTLPVTPGTHVANPVETFAVDGLITDASISAGNANEIVLIGYTKDLTNLFMWLLSDYQEDKFFSGNKRRLNLGSSLQGQIEGVTLTSNGNGYISSEQITTSFYNKPPQLYSFSIANYISSK